MPRRQLFLVLAAVAAAGSCPATTELASVWCLSLDIREAIGDPLERLGHAPDEGVFRGHHQHLPQAWLRLALSVGNDAAVIRFPARRNGDATQTWAVLHTARRVVFSLIGNGNRLLPRLCAKRRGSGRPVRLDGLPHGGG